MLNRKWLIVRRVLIVLCAVVLLFFSIIYPNTLYFCISFLALVAVMVWDVAHYRCPHCHRLLRQRIYPHEADAGYCSHCGELIEWDDTEEE